MEITREDDPIGRIEIAREYRRGKCIALRGDHKLTATFENTKDELNNESKHLRDVLRHD